MANDRSRMCRANPHPRHARVTISVSEVDAAIDPHVPIICASGRENQRSQDHDLECKQKTAHNRYPNSAARNPQSEIRANSESFPDWSVAIGCALIRKTTGL